MPTLPIHRRIVFARCLLAASLLTTGPITQAAVITQTGNFLLEAPTQEIIAANPGNGSAAVVTSNAAAGNSQTTLSFDFFDPSQGTLNSVTFLFSTSLVSQLALSFTPNPGSSPEDDDYFATVDFSVTWAADPFGTTTQSDSSTVICHPELAPACPQTQSIIDAPGSLATPGTAPFIGLGSFDVTATLDWSALAMGPDNDSNYADNATLAAQFDISWGSDVVTLEYVYTPNSVIPEPMSLLLVGAALAAVASLRRRRA